MRKIEKLALRKIVDPTDILKKKQMGKLWGGRMETCCSWCCTIDKDGNTNKTCDAANSFNECWSQAEAACDPYTDYGFIIWNGC